MAVGRIATVGNPVVNVANIGSGSDPKVYFTAAQPVQIEFFDAAGKSRMIHASETPQRVNSDLVLDVNVPPGTTYFEVQTATRKVLYRQRCSQSSRMPRQNHRFNQRQGSGSGAFHPDANAQHQSNGFHPSGPFAFDPRNAQQGSNQKQSDGFKPSGPFAFDPKNAHGQQWNWNEPKPSYADPRGSHPGSYSNQQQNNQRQNNNGGQQNYQQQQQQNRQQQQSDEAPKLNTKLSPQEVEYFYGVLGVPTGTSMDQVKREYRRLALQNHPDKMPNATPEEKAAAAERMKAINSAYQSLVQNSSA